jgi:GNAT superfamily N-acetyltransferase
MAIVVGHAEAVRDAWPISRLINICVDERRTVLNRFTMEEERDYLLGLGSREAVFVAYVGGVFAGFAGVAPRWGYSDRLVHCGEPGTWVMPEYRGKGVGRALWEKGIFPWCREHRFTHLGACVMAHNTGAIAFYEKQGFKICGYHSRMVDWDGEKLDSVEIELCH